MTSAIHLSISLCACLYVISLMFPPHRYLAGVKRRGHALDPVAHFHLQNGASIWRLNWLADVGSNGLQRSYGLMVNYHYDLPHISSNSDRYRLTGQVAVSDSLSTLLDS